MCLEDFKTISEIFNNIVLGISIVIGGIWGYFKFVKGRLFAPKIDLSLDFQITEISDENYYAIMNLKVKNIGNIRIIPSGYKIDLYGVKLDDSELIFEEIASHDILLEKEQKWHIEPDVVAGSLIQQLVPKEFHVLQAEIIFTHSVDRRTMRAFSTQLKPNPNSKSSMTG